MRGWGTVAAGVFVVLFGGVMYGGGIYSTASLGVTNSTLSGNTTGLGGSYALPCVGNAPSGVGGGLATSGGTATLSYATLADNADGIDNLAGTVTLGGTIVADSTAANCSGAISETSGFNLDSGTTCGLAAATDITGTEPSLGALAANGGPTPTQALEAGSPAIDHGGMSGTGCPAVDQRGVARPDGTSDAGSCDIGAYESQGIG
jgi:fibronectin-binding autotransporter adhesin